MKRVLLAGAIACIGVSGALAVSPKVESATKTFKTISSDPAKVKTFCEMIQVMDEAGEKEDAAAEAKVTSLMKQLGPDFEAAWNAAEDLDENSEDGKAYNAALDELADKCT